MAQTKEISKMSHFECKTELRLVRASLLGLAQAAEQFSAETAEVRAQVGFDAIALTATELADKFR